MNGMAGTVDVDVDCSMLEGEGQILRLSAALSCITGKKIKISKIREEGDPPGLGAQDLRGLNLVKAICAGHLDGAELGSSEVTLTPGKIKSGIYEVDTGTAESVSLLLQASLPCAFFGPSTTKLHLIGGTNVEMAPHVEYTKKVFKPILEKFFGVEFDLVINKRGYSPDGHGDVLVLVTPKKDPLTPLVMMERGDITKIHGHSFCTPDPRKGQKKNRFASAKGIREWAEKTIRKDLQGFEDPSVPLNIQLDNQEAHGTGNGIIIIAESSTGCLFAGSALGKRGDKAKEVGKKAAEMLIENINHNGCVDDFLQDQLIIFMALAKGTSQIKTGVVTEHTKTAVHVAELLTEAEFTITACEDGSGCSIIKCKGTGHTNPNK